MATCLHHLATATDMILSKGLKASGQWDPKGSQARQQAIRTAFNRPTAERVDEVLSELAEQIDSDQISEEVRSKAVGVFVNKASTEPGFVTVHASLIAECNDKQFVRHVLRESERKWVDIVDNPSEGDDNLASQGIASWMGAMTQVGVEDMAQSIVRVGEIVKLLEGGSRSSMHVEMIKSFVSAAGEPFAQATDESFWQRIEALARGDLPARLHFLLVDVLDSRGADGQRPPPRPAASQDAVDREARKLRVQFSEFLDSETIPAVAKNTTLAIRAALSILLDYQGDWDVFPQFVGHVIGNGPHPEIELPIDTILRQWREDKIERDFPKAWQVITAILIELAIRGSLSEGSVQHLHGLFEGSSWDFYGDVKFYLGDRWDFTESCETQIRNQEIYDALLLPEAAKERAQIRGSKLMAIAAVRSVCGAGDKSPLDALKGASGMFRSLMTRYSAVLLKEVQGYDKEVTMQQLKQAIGWKDHP